MHTRGELRIDPGSIEGFSPAGEMEVVVPYTEWGITEALLKRTAALTAGLNVRLTLVAVNAIPYPAAFPGPTAVQAHLVEQLEALAGQCMLPVQAQVVVARSREEGFRHMMRPDSMVLVGTRKRPWRTAEERLAKMLVNDGHKVALVHVS
jgi:hypothetical protein